MSYLVLRNVKLFLPFTLQVDTSNVGVGAVLSHPDKEGLEHPVAYFSRKLLPGEQRFLAIEKQYLAIKLGVEAFSDLLNGKRIYYSDGP